MTTSLAPVGKLTKKQEKALAKLAETANTKARSVELHIEDAVEAAVQCGIALAEVKALLPHGAFGPWLEANFQYSARHARNFMQMAAHRDVLLTETATALPESKRLSVRQALRAIAADAAPLTAEFYAPAAVPAVEVLPPEDERAAVEEAGEVSPAEQNGNAFPFSQRQERRPPAEISDARAFVGAALSQLERIAADDPRRDAAIGKVLAWIIADGADGWHSLDLRASDLREQIEAVCRLAHEPYSVFPYAELKERAKALLVAIGAATAEDSRRQPSSGGRRASRRRR